MDNHGLKCSKNLKGEQQASMGYISDAEALSDSNEVDTIVTVISTVFAQNAGIPEYFKTMIQ